MNKRILCLQAVHIFSIFSEVVKSEIHNESSKYAKRHKRPALQFLEGLTNHSCKIMAIFQTKKIVYLLQKKIQSNLLIIDKKLDSEIMHIKKNGKSKKC